MGPAAVLFLIVIGVPFILICAGFFILSLRLFRGNGNAEREKTLELAREIERSIDKMDKRLNALEDIIMTSQSNRGGKYDEL